MFQVRKLPHDLRHHANLNTLIRIVLLIDTKGIRPYPLDVFFLALVPETLDLQEKCVEIRCNLEPSIFYEKNASWNLTAPSV